MFDNGYNLLTDEIPLLIDIGNFKLIRVIITNDAMYWMQYFKSSEIIGFSDIIINNNNNNNNNNKLGGIHFWGRQQGLKKRKN